MAKLIDILKNRIDTSDDIASWLFTEAQSIMKQAANHLKHVSSTMPEFDLHDSTHSEAVLGIIEGLLGDNAQNLSSFELFFIIASAYLHDCGMAISDYEMKVMELTEGTPDKFISNDSLKNDGKKCFTHKEAKAFITKNKAAIYQDFSKEIQNWLFVPHSENDLIEYLSSLLIEYQEFRNGNFSVIKSSKDFAKTNQSLRVEYIRRTHHKRIYEYIKNWGNTKFSAFPVSGLGQRIATDLASICKAHGEAPEYLSDLETHIEYCGRDSNNLQFIAMLLRIGDIAHFSNERAPLELRSLQQFDSDYSFGQWKIKSNGINYNIKNGTIAFRAFFTIPSDYYDLNNYIDWIDNELGLFQRLIPSWDNKYHISITDKVDRSNITFDTSIFTPVPGLKFTLNQTKIIELLMGVGLYKNSFACIRELYQNSLDACRCQIAKDDAVGKLSKGFIEFGIDTENGEKYLYCLDNGKGMSKTIIENYLLKIGSSYYQSPDFYQNQAETGFKFTPTSQFGIGILSCFIIGNRIEIITKEESGDYVACSLDGPREFFYYKNPLKNDKDSIRNSGTIVKVYLKEEYSEKINTKEISNIGIISYDSHGFIQRLRPDLKEDYNNWENSLYKILDEFVTIIPKQIELYVKWDNKNLQKVISKPFIYSSETLQIADLNAIDARINMFGNVCDFKLQDYIDLVDCNIFEINHKGIQYKTIIKLPKPGIESYGYNVMNNIPIKYSSGVCVDGVSLSYAGLGAFTFAEILAHHGLVNFCGENRPRLSLDRTTIIDGEDGKYEDISKEVIRMVIEQAIEKTHEHIDKYKICQGSTLYNMVWKSIFDSFCYSSSVFIETLSKSIYNDISWNNLSLFIGDELTVGEFIQKEKVEFPNYDICKLNSVSKNIVLNKLFTATEIQIRENKVDVCCVGTHNDSIISLSLEDEFVGAKFLVRTNNYGHTFDNYDIISNLYPIIPDFLFDLVEPHPHEWVISNQIKKIDNYSNGIAAFYNQNPFEVDEELGLYQEEKDLHKGQKHIRSLHNKRPSFYFSDIKALDNMDNKQCKLVLTAYIAPRELSDERIEELEVYKETKPSYYKGVTEGWSIIVTGEHDDKANTFIKAGKCTRNELVKLIPASFWEQYIDHIHVFPNGTVLEDLK